MYLCVWGGLQKTAADRLLLLLVKRTKSHGSKCPAFIYIRSCSIAGQIDVVSTNTAMSLDEIICTSSFVLLAVRYLS